MMWKQLAAGDVRRAAQLPVVPGAAALVLGLLLGEGLDPGREVAAEDDVERPDVPDQVRGRVAGQRQREQRAGQQREQHVVLERLVAHLADEAAVQGLGVLPGPLAGHDVLDLEVVQRTPHWKNVISRNA